MKPYYERGSVKLYLGDCREMSPLFVERGIVIFDAPYSDHVHTKSRAGSRKIGGNARAGTATAPANFARAVDFNFASLSDGLRQHLAAESARLATRWVLSFSDVESCHLWRESFTTAGLDYVRTAAWRKIGATPQFTGDRPATAFECITIAHPRGRKRWNGGGRHGWWDAPAEVDRDDLEAFDGALVYERPICLDRGGAGEPRINETQKPERLMLDLVDDFTDAGELVYDFTAGGGTTLVAAIRRGRRAIGIEMREPQAEKTARRLESEFTGAGYHAAARGQTGLFGA